MIETNANDGYEDNLHLLYKTKGNGKATIFMDGKQIDGVWKKILEFLEHFCLIMKDLP